VSCAGNSPTKSGDAERDFTRMRTLAERVRNGAAIAGALVGLGLMAERRNELAAALTHYREGAERYAHLGDRIREGEARLRAAAVLNTQDHVRAAVEERATRSSNGARAWVSVCGGSRRIGATGSVGIAGARRSV
jgi:hypothetical protein